VATTLKETETTNKEVTVALTEQSKEEPKEATTIDAATAVPVIVETKEVVIEKTEEKAREVIIEDPTANEIAETTEKESEAEDEKPNGKTEA